MAVTEVSIDSSMPTLSRINNYVYEVGVCEPGNGVSRVPPLSLSLASCYAHIVEF